MSLAIAGQTNLAAISLLEARIPGWAIPCSAVKTARLCVIGTTGLAWPVETSHKIVESPSFNSWILKLDEAIAAATSGQESWSLAKAVRLNGPPNEVSTAAKDCGVGEESAAAASAGNDPGGAFTLPGLRAATPDLAARTAAEDVLAAAETAGEDPVGSFISPGLSTATPTIFRGESDGDKLAVAAAAGEDPEGTFTTPGLCAAALGSSSGARGGRDKASATTFRAPAMCRMSEVNSAR
jgi:hypothetical protein